MPPRHERNGPKSAAWIGEEVEDAERGQRARKHTLEPQHPENRCPRKARKNIESGCDRDRIGWFANVDRMEGGEPGAHDDVGQPAVDRLWKLHDGERRPACGYVLSADKVKGRA